MKYFQFGVWIDLNEIEEISSKSTLLIPILFVIRNLFPSIEKFPGYLKIETFG